MYMMTALPNQSWVSLGCQNNETRPVLVCKPASRRMNEKSNLPVHMYAIVHTGVIIIGMSTTYVDKLLRVAKAVGSSVLMMPHLSHVL